MFTTIIQPEDVNMASCRIFDCRARLGEPDWGLSQYLAGHISGAQHLDLDQDLASAPGSRGRHPLPDQEKLAHSLAAKGLKPFEQAVVYDDAGGAFAARAWWCLRWLGHEAVAVLDGGLGHWQPPLVDGTEAVVPGNFYSQSGLTRQIDADALHKALGVIQLIDARSQPRFAGLAEPIDKIAGHIPGATCWPFQNNLADNGQFKAQEELAANFSEVTGECVVYCGSGVTAAHNILAMKIAGMEEPMLYPGSWSEWIEDLDRPREP